MNKLSTIILWLSFFIAIVLAPMVFAQNGNALKFEHLTVKDGLLGNNVYFILQDNQGFLWFGTRNRIQLIK
jgi:hypothetical protein